MSKSGQKPSPSSFFSKIFSSLLSSPKPVAQSQIVQPNTSLKIVRKKSDSRRDYTKAIFEALPDLIFVFDRKGTFVDYKPSHFGGPRAPSEQFIGKNIAEVLPMHISVASIDAMQQAFAHGGVRVIEYEGIVNGKEHIFEGRYVAMSRNQALAIIRDITDRKEIEERLEQRNFELNTLIENLLLGVVMEDEGRHVTHINEELFNLFKLPKDENTTQREGVAFAKRLAELYCNPEKFMQRTDDIAHHLEKVMGEEWELKDGRFVQVDYMPICHEGICRGHLWMYRDITEHKKIDQMKTDFITIASHQLRTPLTGVKWISELLLKGKVGRLNTEQREMVGHLIESNERMVVLVNDLLNVSRIEAGKMDVLESKQEDMIAFIHSIIEELTPVAAKKNVTIIFSSHPPQLEISFDAGKLRQAMVNVVSNAIKYSPEKSKVELGVKNTATAIVFSCQDQGIGIPPTEQGRLFEKFFRASNALKYQAEGSGLGLYITNSLVGLHGGKLWFESKEGQGTTFYISLPLKK